MDVPYLTNLRLDPFERQGWPNDGTKEGAQQYFDWFKFQFWRFVFVQQVVGKELQTFLEFPPMQKGASFNLDAVKAEMAKRMEQAEAARKGPGQLDRNNFNCGRLARAARYLIDIVPSSISVTAASNKRKRHHDPRNPCGAYSSIAMAFACSAVAANALAADPLPSWNDSAPKKAIAALSRR